MALTLQAILTLQAEQFTAGMKSAANIALDGIALVSTGVAQMLPTVEGGP